MNEKAYKRALRAHRITLQSLRQLLMLISFKKDLSSLLSQKCWSTDNIPEVTKSEKDARRICRTKIRGKCQLQVLVELHGNGIYSPHVLSGSERGDMVPILAQFTPHVSNFLQICPSELCKIGISVHFRDVSVAQGCLRRVQEGKSRFTFDQVSPDDSLEWLDRIGIRSGRIVDMTNTLSALSRWALSYNLRSRIAEHTHTMFRLHQEDKFLLNESNFGRRDRDSKDK